MLQKAQIVHLRNCTQKPQPTQYSTYSDYKYTANITDLTIVQLYLGTTIYALQQYGTIALWPAIYAKRVFF